MSNAVSRPEDTITFGKYRGHSVEVLNDDLPYCRWLVKQPFVQSLHPEVAMHAEAVLAVEYADYTEYIDPVRDLTKEKMYRRRAKKLGLRVVFP